MYLQVKCRQDHINQYFSVWQRKIHSWTTLGARSVRVHIPNYWRFCLWYKLKTFRRSLNKISTYRANMMISRLRMFNHASLALELNNQNANGSIIDVQWFKSPFGVSFLFAHNWLRQVTYVKKGKQARIEEKQTLNFTSDSWFFYLILKWHS